MTPRWIAPLHLAAYLDVLERAPGADLRVVVAAPPQHGKPLCVDVPVTMADGSLRAIGELCVGDEVVSGYGRLTRVTAVYDQGELEVVRIRLRSGREIVAEGSHRFLTQDGWKRADALRAYNRKNWERPRGDALMVLAHHDQRTRSLGGEDIARLLGYMIGDGNSTGNNARFTNVDPAIRARFISALEAIQSHAVSDDPQTLRVVNRDARRPLSELRAYHAAYERARRNGTELPRMPRRRHRLREVLGHHGVAGSKAADKRVPEAMFSAPRAEVAAFLAAYFECDGTRAARWEGNKAGAGSSFSSVSRELLVGVRTLLGRLGIRTNLYVKRGRYKGELHISWHLAVLDDARFFDLVPVLGKKGGASDRSRRYEPQGIHLRDTVMAVEPAGRKHCVCITVADDESFVASDVVTHNTESTTHAFAWWLKKWPHLRYAYATYSGDRSSRVGRRALLIAQRAEAPLTAANTELWLTREDGQVLWTSVGGGMTGEPVDGCIVIDDPLKDRKEAESPTYRQNLKDWYHGVVETRLHPGASVIVMATRWHSDDLSGYLVREQGFEYLNLKAIADEDRPELDKREVGQALWEEHHPLKTLQERQRGNVWNFSSLYQGQPQPRGGSLFRDPTYYTQLPERGFRVVYGLDFSYSAKTHADFSVCVELWVVPPLRDGDLVMMYVVNVDRKQVEASAFALTLKARHSRRPGKMFWIASGTELGTASFMRKAGLPVIVRDPRGRDKLTRALGTAELWNLGRIQVPLERDGAEHEWVDAFVDEITHFTGVSDPSDDQVDALVSAAEEATKIDGLGVVFIPNRHS